MVSPLGALRGAISEAIDRTFPCLPIEIFHKISFEIGYPKYKAHFTTAIALTLAGHLKLDTLLIAEAIASYQGAAKPSATQWQIQAVGKGWLNISLRDQYLANALLDLWQSLDSSKMSPKIAKVPEPRLQYVYARCCALLRLATNYQDLREDQACLPQFRDCLQPEIILLLRNLAIADYLENKASARRDLGKILLRSLATDFLSFYDQCRIFGVSADIAYRRVLIIEVTQKMILRLSEPEIAYAEYL
ncbi:MAG: hypothetical protein AUK48_14310 [Oscillatoriales cyanobacterium CG2_30_44_21]|nr:MAG: hypothetical protein AUK48_14310 [Oscillatoriales cyanobacterium CG2_30_44_21]